MDRQPNLKDGWGIRKFESCRGNLNDFVMNGIISIMNRKTKARKVGPGTRQQAIQAIRHNIATHISHSVYYLDGSIDIVLEAKSELLITKDGEIKEFSDLIGRFVPEPSNLSDQEIDQILTHL